MKKKKKSLFILILLLIIIYTSINLVANLDKGINPPVWRISKGRKELIAIATVHSIPEEKSKLGYKTSKYIKEADYLLLSEDTVKDSSYTMSKLKSPLKTNSVKDILLDNEKEKLKDICDLLGIKYEDIIEKTSSEALNIIIAYQKNYIQNDPHVRLSSIIAEDFYNNNKSVYECEGYDEKQEILNRFKDFIVKNNYDELEDDEFKMLINSEFEANLMYFRNWYKNNQEAYISGDVDKLENGMKYSSSYYEIYEDNLRERNEKIYEKIIKRNEYSEGKPLLAFEINTLLGDKGLLKFFIDDGYTIERIN